MTKNSGQRISESHSRVAAIDDEGSPIRSGIQNGFATLVIAQIRELHYQRQSLVKLKTHATNTRKAIGRRLDGKSPANEGSLSVIDMPGDLSDGAKKLMLPTILRPHDEASASVLSIDRLPHDNDGGNDQTKPDTQTRLVVATFAALPFVAIEDFLKPLCSRHQRSMERLVKELPGYAFQQSINGFGPMGFAQIIGEAGDLSNYATVSKLWKRMCLAVFDGRAQRRVRGAGAIEQGFNPARRAVMHCIGDSLIKKQGPYRELYLTRKEYERDRDAEKSDQHTHRMALRYMEKRLLRDLWRAWRMEAGT